MAKLLRDWNRGSDADAAEGLTSRIDNTFTATGELHLHDLTLEARVLLEFALE
jgi:hypothetical protein